MNAEKVKYVIITTKGNIYIRMATDIEDAWKQVECKEDEKIVHISRLSDPYAF